jgi:hypothetical protein
MHVLLQVSGDRGKTWSQPVAIDPEATKGGQYDPQIAVDPVDGKTVWASFLQNSKSSIAVMKSTDFGQTWSGPIIVENLQRSTDKDILAVRGSTVAVAYNAVQKVYAAISHDGGQTWTNSLISSGNNQLGWSLGGGGGVDSQGNIYFTFDGYTQNGQAKGPVNLWASVTHDGGASWIINEVGVSGAPYPCSNCGFAFLGAQITMAVGSDDTVYILWNSTVDQTDYAPERIFFAKMSRWLRRAWSTPSPRSQRAPRLAMCASAGWTRATTARGMSGTAAARTAGRRGAARRASPATCPAIAT